MQIRRQHLGRHLVPLLILCLAAPLAAQKVGPDYRISSGDVLRVDVWGDETLSKEYFVGPAGTINIPILGQVQVADLTMAQAQELVTEALRKLVKDPQVTVSINEKDSVRQAYVLGYVEKQGPVVLPFGAGVVDALAAAGTTQLSDLSHVQLSRPGETTRTLDLSGLRTAAPVPIGEKLRWGDILYVPRLDQRIAVLGQVKTPSSALLPLGEEVSVLDALARLGGGLTTEASLADAMLIHADGTSERLNLQRLVKEGDTTQNRIMRAGDVLVIQQVENISVVGEVGRPVTFASADPVPLLQALAAAGSFTPKADLTRARIISRDGQRRDLDLKALWEQGDVSQNVQLQPGDVLLLPERAPENLLVVGAVGRPGIVNLQELKQRDILRIVTLAGPGPQSDLTRVRVYRANEQLTVNVQEIMDKGNLEKNLELQLDDVVMVPERQVVYLMGAFAGQGKVPWKPGLTLTDAILTVGGFQARANTNKVTLLRTHEDGTPEFITARYGKIGSRQAPPNIEMQPGDLVYCPFSADPEVTFRTLSNWLWLFSVVSGFFD